MSPLVPPRLGYWAGFSLGRLMGDVMITRDEIERLVAGLLFVDSPPCGETRPTAWARANAGIMGLRYASELARRRWWRIDPRIGPPYPMAGLQ